MELFIAHLFRARSGLDPCSELPPDRVYTPTCRARSRQGLGPPDSQWGNDRQGVWAMAANHVGVAGAQP